MIVIIPPAGTVLLGQHHLVQAHVEVGGRVVHLAHRLGPVAGGAKDLGKRIDRGRQSAAVVPAAVLEGGPARDQRVARRRADRELAKAVDVADAVGRASRSRLGVFTSRLPQAPRQSKRSWSTWTMSTFGRTGLPGVAHSGCGGATSPMANNRLGTSVLDLMESSIPRSQAPGFSALFSESVAHLHQSPQPILPAVTSRAKWANERS